MCYVVSMATTDSHPPHQCEQCSQRFYYAPANHRCPGEWEAMVGEMPPVPLTSWDEECVAKVMDR